MPKGTPVTFNQLKNQILERKYKDIMPSYYDRAAKVRPNLPEYDDKALQDKLEQVVIKIAMLRLLVDDAKSKRELHQMRKSMDYNLAVKRFIKREQRKRERRLQEAEELLNKAVEIVEIKDEDEQSAPDIEDRKPTREEFEEMEREELRQIGLDLRFSHLHINDLKPVAVPDLNLEFTDRELLFEPEIKMNFVPSIYDIQNHDMHFLDVLFSVDDTAAIEPTVSNVSLVDNSSAEALPLTITLEEEPVSNHGAYGEGLIDYRLALDVRTGNAFPSNKFAERLYIGNDGNYYGIDPYDNVRELKVMQNRYVCFGNDQLNRKQDRIYLTCIV